VRLQNPRECVPGQALAALPVLLTTAALCAGVALGCAGDRSRASPGTGAIRGIGLDLFRPDELLRIEIEMPDEDWENLRWQGRSLPRVYAGCFEFDGYTYFDAEVTINGETVEDAAVRKKGFLGSLSATRPSLKIDLGRTQAHRARTLHGTRRLTLNNDKQDLSNVRQCLSYALFAKAGIRAPRCNWAHVTAQGKDLGIYSHVEPIKRPFLLRAFGDARGNLYEGQVSDFSAGRLSTFELKTNEQQNDRSDLDAVAQALKTGDTEVWDALDEAIDMDAFLTFWAMEVLVGHWDSYSGNQNNFYLYRNPKDHRFRFIPWGTDGAFADKPNERSGVLPRSVFLGSELTARLWRVPRARARYVKRLRQLMDVLWDEDLLNAEVERIGRMTGAPAPQLDLIKTFVNERQARIERELEGSVPPWPEAPRRSERVCRPPPASRGTFELVWTDSHSYAPGGRFAFDLKVGGRRLAIDRDLYCAAGPVQEPDDPTYGVPRIAFTGADSRTGRKFWVGLYIPEAQWREGEIPFHGYETFGVVLELFPSGGYRRLAVVGEGTITLEQAGHSNGSVVKGRWAGRVATTQ
jgi:spore coat protein H